MSTPNDDLFHWTLNHMPRDVVDLSLQLDLNTDVDHLSTDGTDHVDSIFYSRGPLATLRTAVFLFVIECGLPQDQWWLFYWLMVYSRQNLVRYVYAMAYAESLLLWYFPVLRPRVIYVLNLVLDGYIRSTNAFNGVSQEEALRTCFSQISDPIIIYALLQDCVNLDGLTPWLELVFGPASFWPWAISPILPGTLFLDEAAPINAFTPERSQGLVMAAALWCCTKLLPKWIQWALWPMYSAPDYDNKGMTSKWLLCTLLWIWVDTPVPVAYGLYLFANQFIQMEHTLRYESWGPSEMLRRERYGWVCFVAMSLLLRLVEVSELVGRAELLSLGLPLWSWCLFIPTIAFGVGLVPKKWPARRARFKHKPLRGLNQIRLLRVRPQYLRNEQMHCDMVHVDLASPPQYTAISYRWGLAEEKMLVIMINGAPFPVSRSLHTLLSAKRKSRHNLLFWIDAVCINQSDTMEKNQQVSLMRRIFEEATSTIGWLGDDPGVGKALDLVQRINQMPNQVFSKTLQQESNSGWKELSDLVANDWFQRVWIIQEIAVSKSPWIRYGKQELEWKELVNALCFIIAHGSACDVPDDLLHSRFIVNALVIENIRICMTRVDYLHLEDVLKLGAIFQATLPVDKVFALLGVAEEHNRSFLSLDYSEDILDLDIWHAKNLFHDLYRTVNTINDIKSTLSGSRNSRRGWAIRSNPNGVKYLKKLMRDENWILKDLQWLAGRQKKLSPDKSKQYDVLRPEYSKQTTPESVYSLVAKVAVGKGKGHSIIRHAGIGASRNEGMQNLPSWVPDWSSALHSCILPSRNPSSPWEAQIEDQNARAAGTKKRQPISHESVRDASFGFYYLRGQIFGTIRYLAALSEDVAGNFKGESADVIEAARHAFHSQLSSYTKALSLAANCCHDRYKTREAIESAFFRTVLAGVGPDGCTPASESEVARCKSWVYGVRDDCRVAMAVEEPEDASAHWTKLLGVHDPDMVQSLRKQICAKYMFIRRMQCSTSTKFACMVRTTVVPSFEEYRLENDDIEDHTANSSVKSKVKDQHLSFFDDKDAGPLGVYREYTDYTLGRKLAITDSGQISLVPWGAREGDLIVCSSSEKLCLLLRRSKPHELADEGKTGRKNPVRLEEMFRLVGDAYVHELFDIELETKKQEDRIFKIW